MLREVASVWPEKPTGRRQVFSGVIRAIFRALTTSWRKRPGSSANSRMPDPASNIATGIAARLGQPGITRAVVPSWGRIVVDDIYSNSAEGQRHLTVSAIVGDLLLGAIRRLRATCGPDRLMTGNETYCFGPVEIRAEATGRTLTGVIVPFGTVSPSHRERFLPGSLTPAPRGRYQRCP